MERLTIRDAEGTYFITPMGNALSVPELRLATVQVLLDSLAAYEDAEEQGLLIKLPCKVGGAIYLTIEKKVQKATVSMFHIDSMGLEVEAVYNNFGLTCFCGRLGVNVFATKEEAEAALAKEG